MSCTRPIRAGWAFLAERRKLYHFTDRSILVLKVWPEIRAWRKLADQPFQPWRPELPASLIRTTPPHPKRNASTREWARWRRESVAWQYSSTIPERVRQMVARFPDARFEVLQGLAIGGGRAMELAESNPALYLALVNNPIFRKRGVKQRTRSVRNWCDARRPRLAGWLGFPATQQAVNILGRLRPEDLFVWRLLRLRALLWAGCANFLSNLPLRRQDGTLTLDGLLLDTLWDAIQPRGPIPARALDGLRTVVAVQPRRATEQLGRLLGDARTLSQLQQCPWPPNLAKGSLRELRNYHDQLLRRPQTQAQASARTRDFPPPPLAGVPGYIEPIISAEDLLREGREMRHCAGLLPEHAVSGATYFYRVLQPQRATLSLKRTNGRWMIDQMALQCNRDPEEATWLAAHAWLEANATPRANLGEDPF